MSEQSSENPESSSEGASPDPKKDRPAKTKIPLRKDAREPAPESSESETPAHLPIRPRTSVTKIKEATDDKPSVEESPRDKEAKEPEKEAAPSRLKPSGKPFSVHKPREKEVAPEEVEEVPISKEKERETPAPTEKSTKPKVEANPKVETHSKAIPERKRPSILRRIFRIQVPLVAALGVLVLATILAGLRYHGKGVAEGKRQSEVALNKEIPPLAPEFVARLDEAVFNLRTGRTVEALNTLTDLESNSNYPSLTFLVGLAALQSGNVDLVEKQAKASIRKKEKISDSLALLAVVESQRANDKSRVKMGSSIKRSEALLAQAIAADPANPYPRFELATLLRYDRRKEEAAVQLKGARYLLNPIDSHSIMDITTKIMAVEAMPVDQIPTKNDPSDNPLKLIPDAYAAMRIGDFTRAASLLRAAKEVLSPESFDYLVNDPALRRYAREAALAEFYTN